MGSVTLFMNFGVMCASGLGSVLELVLKWYYIHFFTLSSMSSATWETYPKHICLICCISCLHVLICSSYFSYFCLILLFSASIWSLSWASSRALFLNSFLWLSFSSTKALSCSVSSFLSFSILEVSFYCTYSIYWWVYSLSCSLSC